ALTALTARELEARDGTAPERTIVATVDGRRMRAEIRTALGAISRPISGVAGRRREGAPFALEQLRETQRRAVLEVGPHRLQADRQTARIETCRKRRLTRTP